MTVLNKIAYFRERGDEVPNQELARELAEKKDHKGIQEIAEIRRVMDAGSVITGDNGIKVLAVDANSKDAFTRLLENRMTELSSSQVKRVKKIIQEAEK